MPGASARDPAASPGDVGGFYDGIAEDYHLILAHANWRETVEAQGVALDAMLRTRLRRPSPWRLLDCSCGIGTQAIGLALLGHRVLGTDLSPGAIARARAEALSFGVSLELAVADMRCLESEIGGEFDAVITCDNSLAHLQGADLAAALRAMRAVLAVGGVALGSIRDYDAIAPKRARMPDPPRVHDTERGKRIGFQVWDWDAPGESYLLNQFLVSEEPCGFATSHATTRLYAHRRADLVRAFEDAGLVEPRWHLPGETPGYYQPVLTGLAA